MTLKFTLILLIALVFIGSIFLIPTNNENPVVVREPINGVNLVAPPRPFPEDALKPVLDINANWVAVVPYAFSRPSQPEVFFNTQRQWWGERHEGVITTIQYAKNLGLKVMLKPHVWVKGEGWTGDFTLASDSSWQTWEKQYETYVLSIVDIADSMDVEMVCIGTEYRKAVVKRPQFWINLINKIRERYQGKLTYAANWDNFQNVSFWGKLDYIGIDAYFPLSTSKIPEPNELKSGWEEPYQAIERFQQKWDKPIIFTEYGYESREYANDGHWKHNPEYLNANMEVQSRAYNALYQTFWDKPWFAGGFLWKWFPDNEKAGGLNNKRYTPQNKPVREVIKKWYGDDKRGQSNKKTAGD